MNSKSRRRVAQHISHPAEQARFQVPEYPFDHRYRMLDPSASISFITLSRILRPGPVPSTSTDCRRSSALSISGHRSERKRDDWLAQGDDEKRKAVDQFRARNAASMGSLYADYLDVRLRLWQGEQCEIRAVEPAVQSARRKNIHDFPDTDPDAPLSDNQDLPCCNSEHPS